MYRYHLNILIVVLLFSNNFLVAQIGPGGIGNSLSNKLWLKGDGGAYINAGVTQASNGQQVQQWKDCSGNNNHAVQNSAGNKPLYHTNSTNGQPGLRFTGDMFIDGPNLAIPASNSYTYILVFRDTISVAGGINDGAGQFILDRTTATNNLVSLKPVSGNSYGYQKRNNSGGGLGGPLTTTSINTNTKIIQMQRNYNSTYKIYYNALLEATLVDADGPTFPPNPRIGRHATTANGGIKGYINEFIIYDFALNNAQTVIVNNYLSAKYDVPLSVDDIYTQDDVGRGNYDYDVAGIGRIDSSNIHSDAQGGIIRILNPNNLGDNEFLIWGHDNGIEEAIETSDVPFGVVARFDRTWRVNEVNISGGGVNVGDLDMRWDLTALGPVSASDLRLLIDTDNDGVFSDETPISGATSLGSNIYEFSSVSGGATGIRNNTRFTLGTINKGQTPLPVKLLSFEANFNVDRVDLKWVTSTEINNDFFTIEKSKDLKNWEIVSNISAAGNTNTNVEYFEVDYFPYQGVSYYRLKQTDYDGTFSYSNIVPVKVDKKINGEFGLFPNPVKRGEQLKIQFSEIIDSEVLIVIKDAKGEEFYSKAILHSKDGLIIAIPIDKEIPSGIYIVNASPEDQIYSQKLIIK
ncbi:MAG: T9SS type A sorting domain-containing protein [Flavobacteriales bacterium]